MDENMFAGILHHEEHLPETGKNKKVSYKYWFLISCSVIKMFQNALFKYKYFYVDIWDISKIFRISPPWWGFLKVSLRVMSASNSKEWSSGEQLWINNRKTAHSAQWLAQLESDNWITHMRYADELVHGDHAMCEILISQHDCWSKIIALAE